MILDCADAAIRAVDEANKKGYSVTYLYAAAQTTLFGKDDAYVELGVEKK